MKKKLFLLGICATLFITGCSLSDSVTNTIKNVAGTTSQPANDQKPSPTPTTKETNLALGKKGTVGDWTIQVKKFTVKRKIKASKYRYYDAGKGNYYIYFQVSARNNGKKAAQFLPRIGYENKVISATLYYKKDYEYQPTELLGYDKDLTTESIGALTTKSGIVAFKIPKKVAKAKKSELSLKIGTKNEHIVYSLK